MPVNPADSTKSVRSGRIDACSFYQSGTISRQWRRETDQLRRKTVHGKNEFLILWLIF
jgi:hypothetical protein